MSIKVRYFASLAEQVGRCEANLEFTKGMNVLTVWQADNPGRSVPTNMLAAVNMEYVSLGTEVSDHDEVAFFPPITGGQE